MIIYLNKKYGGIKAIYSETIDAYLGLFVALHKISVFKNHETSRSSSLPETIYGGKV
nr:hypothetical protein SYMBAF_40062 [Serratia symbiotica]